MKTALSGFSVTADVFLLNVFYVPLSYEPFKVYTFIFRAIPFRNLLAVFKD